MDRNLEKDLHIDESNLEQEWIEHASRYMYYAEAWSDAVKMKDLAKQKLDIIHAELDEYYRLNWDRYSEYKVTEASLESKIIRHEKYKKALAIYNKHNHNVNLLSSVKTAFEHRKKALENLVSLLITGFHSEPRQRRGESHVKLHSSMKKSLAKNPRIANKK